MDLIPSPDDNDDHEDEHQEEDGHDADYDQVDQLVAVPSVWEIVLQDREAVC